MAKIRVIRILEYIGDEDWIKSIMDRNVIQIGTPTRTPDGTVRELSREYSEPLAPLPAPSPAALDDELPF